MPRHAPAGEYTIQVALRGDDVATLKALHDLPLRVEKALESDLTLPVHDSLASAVRKGAKPAKDFALQAGERRAPACRLSSLAMTPLAPSKTHTESPELATDVA